MRMRGTRWLVLVAVLGSLAAAGKATAQEPIKIGFLSPPSGAIAAAGRDMYSGCELFAKQYAESGLRGKVPLIANGTHTDQHVLPQLGEESIGVISAHHYSAALETPANQAASCRTRSSSRTRT
jgi:ABC-type branched-subunit amino acid transport system substrate-binding protein